MNILHIISSGSSGGAEVYVKDLAKCLSQQGHNLHIAFLGTAADVGRDILYEKEFMNDLRSRGINIYIIGSETRRKPWLGIKRLRKYVIKNNIDICHTHLAYGIVFSALLKVPVIYTHHTIIPRWNNVTYKLFNSLVDRYVGISEKCAENLRDYTGRDVVAIPNAVSKEKFSGYIKKRVTKKKLVIAMIGRLDAQKDYMNMLQALDLLDKDVLKKLKVLIAGEGSPQYKDELLNYIEKNGLDQVVEFVGVKTNIPEFLYEADMFLMSSEWEGLPIALIEATVSGLPCIVTDVGGCSEVITNCKNGVFVSPKDPNKLADEITRFITDDTLIENFSTNAINNSCYYSIDKAAKLHIELYEEAMK